VQVTAAAERGDGKGEQYPQHHGDVHARDGEDVAVPVSVRARVKSRGISLLMPRSTAFARAACGSGRT
jgi:hypothetical protein